VPLKKHTKLQWLIIRDNPVVDQIPHFRLLVINELPQLKFLDEKEISKDEVEEAAALNASGVWSDKEGDRIEKKAKLPVETTERVVPSHLNVGRPSDAGSEQRVSLGETDPAATDLHNVSAPAVKRPDLNVSLPSSTDGGTAAPKKNVRADLNVTITRDGGSGGRGDAKKEKKTEKKEKKEKKKEKKEKKGSKIVPSFISRTRHSNSGATPQENSEREIWPTNPAILAKIASSLTLPDMQSSMAPSHPTEAQAPPSQSAQVTSAASVGSDSENGDSVEAQMDQLRSFFLFEEITHTLALFSLAIATPAWGVAEFANLNTQLKKLVVNTKAMYERVQQYLQRYPFEEKRITEATVAFQKNIRALVLAVKQLNDAQARGGTVSAGIASTSDLLLSLFYLFSVVEETTIPSVEEATNHIQECARAVVKLIKIATGMSLELNIEQYAEILMRQSEQLSHMLTIKIPSLQNPEEQQKAMTSAATITRSIGRMISLSMQYHAKPFPALLQELRQAAQGIAAQLQSLRAIMEAARLASPLSPYDELVMYEASYQILSEESSYIDMHMEDVRPEERQAFGCVRRMMELIRQIKRVVAQRPVSHPHFTQMVLDLSAEGARMSQQLQSAAATYVAGASRNLLEKYASAIRYYSFFERIALCSFILNFASGDVLHLSTCMKGQAFCTVHAIRIVLSAPQAPSTGEDKLQLERVNFDELLTMLK